MIDLNHTIEFTLRSENLSLKQLIRIISLGGVFPLIVLNFDANKKIVWWANINTNLKLTNFGFLKYDYVLDCWGHGQVGLSVTRLLKYIKHMHSVENTFFIDARTGLVGVHAGNLNIFTDSGISIPIKEIETALPRIPIVFDKDYVPVTKEDAAQLKYGVAFEIKELKKFNGRVINSFTFYPNKKITVNFIDGIKNELKLNYISLNAPSKPTEYIVPPIVSSILKIYADSDPNGMFFLRAGNKKLGSIYLMNRVSDMFVSGVLIDGVVADTNVILQPSAYGLEDTIEFTATPKFLTNLIYIVSLGKFMNIVLNFDGQKVWWASDLNNFGYFNYDFVKDYHSKGKVVLSASKLLTLLNYMKPYSEVTFWANPKMRRFGLRACDCDHLIEDSLNDFIPDTAQSKLPTHDLDAFIYGGYIHDIDELKRIVKRAEAWGIEYITFILSPNSIKIILTHSDGTVNTVKIQTVLLKAPPDKTIEYTVPLSKLKNIVENQCTTSIFSLHSLKFTGVDGRHIYLQNQDDTFFSGSLIETIKIQARTELAPVKPESHALESVGQKSPMPLPKYVFIPAQAEQILNVLSLNWWDKNALFPHISALYSAFYLIMRKIKYLKYMKIGWLEPFKNFPAEIRFPPDYQFMLDSGGYELHSAKTKNNPHYEEIKKFLTQENILAIAEAIASYFTRPIIAPILDQPPYIDLPDDPLHYDQKFFDKALDDTDKNTYIAITKRKSPKVRVYGVLQGKVLYHLKKWFERIKKYKVDGWALAPEPKNSYEKTAMYVCFALVHDLKVPLHFFGQSGFNSLALMIYMSRKDEKGIPYYPSLITSDSTSHDAGAKYRSYTTADGSKIIIGRDKDVYTKILKVKDPRSPVQWKVLKKNPKAASLDNLPCNCPVCLTSSPEEMRDSGSIKVSLHNLYCIKQLVDKLIELVPTPDAYVNFVLSWNEGKDVDRMKNFFELIDNIIAKMRGYTPKHGSYGESLTIDSEGIIDLSPFFPEE